MNLKILCSILFAIVFAVGCSTISYDEPTTGDLSRVRFATNETSVVIVRAYENADCAGEKEWMRLRNGVLMNSTPKSLNMPLGNYDKNAAKEFYVPAKQEKVLMFVETGPKGDVVATCGVPLNISFLEKNTDYEFLYTLRGDGCSVDVAKLVKNASGAVRKETYKRFTNTRVGFGDACVEKFKKLRLY
jgi:hypothetical protein